MVDRIIGVDCATNSKKVGLALVEQVERSPCLVTAQCSGGSPAEEIALWARRPGRTLVALDAPLGWPAVMGESLATHVAGEVIGHSGNQLFRRATDRAIHTRYNKTPLDVGADRIARTAHWALGLLGSLRSLLQEPVPLAWSPRFEGSVAAIEVYPAATMISMGLSITGYKAEGGHIPRSMIHAAIATRFRCDGAGDPADWSVDTLDAVVCAVAGLDFIQGHAVAPEDLPLARKEGWIWAGSVGRAE